MFDIHTRLTKLACWLMAFNCVVGAITLAIVLPTFQSVVEDFSASAILVVLFIMLLVFNFYLVYRVYQKSVRALKISVWLYVLQIISIETEFFSFYLNTGLQLTLSWSFENVVLSINFAALAISLLLHKAYKGVAYQNETVAPLP